MFWKRKKTIPVIEEEQEQCEPRQLAMAYYTIKFMMIGGSQHSVSWQDWPQRFMGPLGRPYTSAGLQFKEDGKCVFIPWHQIGEASLKETELWNDGSD